MANPQLENGYTRIANEIIEVLSKTSLSSREYRVIFAILRLTYGFQKTSAKISIGDISEECQIAKSHTSLTVSGLIKKNILRVLEDSDYSQKRTIMFNKNYVEWIVGGVTHVGNSYQIGNSYQSGTKGVTPVGNRGVTKSVTPHIYKEIYKENKKNNSAHAPSNSSGRPTSYAGVKNLLDDD